MQTRLFQLVACLALAAAALSAVGAAHARQMHALLVGVSDYPNLSKDFQLDGPRNDVARMRQLLTGRGFDPRHIAVLADGVENARMPTRANILAELKRIASAAGRDDVVVLFFAGHGSQQPADPRTAAGRAENDGLLEFFLPRDVGKWDGEVGAVKNSLVKTDMREAVDRILGKGAFVWGIFDTCHSATMVRGGKSEVRYRYVDPAALGVPDNAATLRGAPAKPHTAPAARIEPLASGGDSVFFYAAQTREATPEMRLPLGHPEGKQYGLFGFMIMDALESNAPMTYRQMAQYVLTRYGAIGETRVTPLFSGTALDKPVLAQQAAPVKQWKIESGPTLSIDAGALSRLTEGSILAVMPDPLAANDKAIGYLKLTKVGLASSSAVPVAFRNKPAPNPKAIAKGSFARLVQTAPQYGLRVSVDAGRCGADCPALRAVAALRGARDANPGAFAWADAPAPADITLKLYADRIVLLPPSLQGADCGENGAGCPGAAALMPESGKKASAADMQRLLSEALFAAARSANLLRAASLLGEAGRQQSKLEVSVKLRKKQGGQVVYSPEQVPTLRPGDSITVTLTNKSRSAVDATLLYVDSRFGIQALFPDVAGGSNRLEPGASQAIDVEVNDETVGLERMVLIGVEALANQERADFSFLAQAPLAATRGGAGDSADPEVQALMDAGFYGFKTRGVSQAPRAPGTRSSMTVFTFNIAR